MRRPRSFQNRILFFAPTLLQAARHTLCRTVSALTVASMLLTTGPVGMAPAHAQDVRRVALVVGNSGYSGDISPLSNPVNDATDVADALQSIGFDVTRILDADGDGFRRALRTFAGKARGANMAVFYYAGHAMHFDQESYLMPVGVKLEDESQVRFDMISVEDDVLGKTMRDVPLKILLLDACRDNPIAARYEADEKTRSLGKVRGLSPLPDRQPVGQLIAYATSPNQVAVDGEGRNSPFSAALKKHLVEPGVEIRAMLDEVKADVIRATQEHQKPDVHDSLTDKVFLNPGESDREVWLRIEKADDPAVFSDFLSRFPRSDFASAARANIKTLQLEATVKRLEADQARKAEEAARQADDAKENLRKQEQAAKDAARQREEAQNEAARQKAAREAAEARIAAEAAAQKEAIRLQKAQEDSARQEALRLEQASKDAARLEAQSRQAALDKAEQDRVDQLERTRLQAVLDRATHEQAMKDEAARQDQARAEAARIEAARAEAARVALEAQNAAERQAEQSAAKAAAREKALAAQQEVERQVARQAELERLESERKAYAAAQRAWQDASRDEDRRFAAEQSELKRVLAQKQEAARRQDAKDAADRIAAAKAEADRLQAEQQKASQQATEQQKADQTSAQAKLDEAKQRERDAARKSADAARYEQRMAEKRAQAERQAADRAKEAKKAVVQADRTRRESQRLRVERKTANLYGDATPRAVRVQSAQPRQSAPASAPAEAPGCMSCGF